MFYFSFSFLLYFPYSNLNLGKINFMGISSLDQQLGVMDTLSSRANLFSTQKEVIRVGKERVLGVRHGVEGTDGKREFVNNIEVNTMLCLNETAEKLLLGGVNIIIVANFLTALEEKEFQILTLKRASSLSLPLSLSLSPSSPFPSPSLTSLRSLIISGQVRRREGLLYFKSSKGNCLLTASISSLKRSFKPSKMYKYISSSWSGEERGGKGKRVSE